MARYTLIAALVAGAAAAGAVGAHVMQPAPVVVAAVAPPIMGGPIVKAAYVPDAPPPVVPKLAIVINSGQASISLVDMDRQVEIKRLPALREPHHVALSPDRRSLLVGDTAANEMLFLNPVTGEIQRRMTIADPYQLGFSPDGKRLVVTGLARDQIDVYDAATMTLEHRFPVSAMPSHIAFSPDSGMAFVSLQTTGRVVALDLRRMSVAWTSAVGPTPAGMLWLNGRVLSAIMGSDDIVVMNPADGHVERRVVTGKGAHQLFLSPDGKTLWVNNRVAGTTMALDAKTLAVERTYKVPGGPDDIDFAPDGKLWITQRWAKRVAVLDPASGAIDEIDVGRSPHGIFLTTHIK
jgi:DNA-binding beta-propeller fold protein YncE